MFCLTRGLDYLDSVDYYINQWGMLFVGFMESAALSWVYCHDQRVSKAGLKACMWFDVGYFVGVWAACIVFAIMTWSLETEKWLRVVVAVAILLVVWLVSLWQSYASVDDKEQFQHVWLPNG